MSKIYELDISLYNKVHMNPTYDKFIFTYKNKRNVVAVDNTSGDFFTEDFSNKTKVLIYLVNEEFMPNDVEEEYKKNKNKYKNYKKVVSNQHDYFNDRNLVDTDFLDFDFHKNYTFDIDIGFGNQKFSSTIADAVGLSLTYNSNLYYKGILLISPKEYEWNDNLNLIRKYFKGRLIDYSKVQYGIPFRCRDSKEIQWINSKEKNLNI